MMSFEDPQDGARGTAFCHDAAAATALPPRLVGARVLGRATAGKLL
jgi:hypothetical protein